MSLMQLMLNRLCLQNTPSKTELGQESGLKQLDSFDLFLGQSPWCLTGLLTCWVLDSAFVPGRIHQHFRIHCDQQGQPLPLPLLPVFFHLAGRLSTGAGSGLLLACSLGDAGCGCEPCDSSGDLFSALHPFGQVAASLVYFHTP